ncbi:MAG: S8 family serine peptidase [Anaerolineales bacterium]|nr:S8 family serine peptidase [Anaerolineales bacterium]
MQKITHIIAIVSLTAVLLLATILLANQAQAETAVWSRKVDPWVLETAVANQPTEFLVQLTEQADLNGVEALATKEEKGRLVYERLTAVAQRTQPPIVAILAAAQAPHRRYWISNMIWVRGDAALVQQLAQRADVARIVANPAVQIDPLETPSRDALLQAAQGIEWNLQQVNAPAVWEAGVTGQGVVIGGQDTGYDWTHPALKNQYRGWDGTTADHSLSWHDAIHSNNPNSAPGNVCGFDSPEPCDDYGHGTHTLGTMVGDDGAGNQVGMAPGARWVGCRNMEDGWGTPASYSECFEWFVAPYPPGGDPLTDGDPAQAPHVVSNSWSCPTVEGCTDPNIMLAVVDNVRAAGIMTVQAASNRGPGCSSVDTPAAIYDSSFSAGATDSNDNIASFSSRGPVTVDGSNRLKPDISAPGVGIRSTIPGGGYGNSSGTSMASPHVAGLAALLIAANPSLAGQVDAIKELMRQTAVPRTTNEGCGGDSETAVPNHTYGWGRIDAWAAYQASLPPTLTLTKSANAATVRPGGLISYTLTVVNNHPSHTATTLLLTDTLPSDTTLISATVPYTQTGNLISWGQPILAGGSGWQVELVVQVAMTTTLPSIENLEYGVGSAEVKVVRGEGVKTAVLPFYHLYLPVIR